MRGLLRRHAVSHRLAIFLIGTGATSSTVLGVMVFRQSGAGAALLPAQLLAILWLGAAAILVAGPVRRRASDLDLALPLAAPQLWLAHGAAVFLAAGLQVLIALGVIGIHRLVLAGSVAASFGASDLAGVTALAIAGLALAVALIEQRQAERCAVRLDGQDILWRLCVIAGVAALSLLGLGRPRIAAGALLVAAAAALWRRYRWLPAAFLPMAPATAHRDGESTSRPWPGRPRHRSTWQAMRQLFVVVHGNRWGAVTPWITHSWVFATGALAAGVLEIWAPLEDIRVMYIPLYIYMLFAPIPAALEQLAHLDPLPIARRTLFALVIVPSLVVFTLGYGVGALALETAGRAQNAIVYQSLRNDPHHHLSVPAGYLELRWKGTPPPIVAPWGERHEARSTPLFRGSPLDAYSPFQTPRGSSPELVAWQISRAVEAVHRRHIAPEVIQERYLETSNGAVAPKGGRLGLVDDFPELAPKNRGPIFPLVAASTLVPLLLLVMLLQRAYRAGISEQKRRYAWLPVVVVMMVSIIGQLVLTIAGWIEPWTGLALVEIAARKLGMAAGGELAAWALAATLTLAAYVWARSAFEHVELPAKPAQMRLL